MEKTDDLIRRWAEKAIEAKVPEVTAWTFARYIVMGIRPGHFVTAVLSNDLVGAIQRADQVNGAYLEEIVSFMYNCIPVGCWGDAARVECWVHQGGESL